MLDITLEVAKEFEYVIERIITMSDIKDYGRLISDTLAKNQIVRVIIL